MFLSQKGTPMKNLFSTPLNKLYSILTIVSLLMVLFPPVYSMYDGGSSGFRGYKFVLDLYKSHLIDLGRLSLQFIILGLVTITIQRIMAKR